MTDADDLTIERGSDNVFADLGFADADTHRVKADLAHQIGRVMTDRGLTQAEAAKLTGLSQPDISRILRGHFRDVSTDRLLRMLTAMGMSVEISLRPKRASDQRPIQVLVAA